MSALPVRPRRILLELDLTEMPIEQEPDDPLGRLRSRGRHRLRPTVRALHEAARDPRVVGLIARIGGALPWAGMQELRQAVRAFADNQPVTSIVNTIRELFAGQPVSSDIWVALAWCLGILVVAYVFAMITYHRKIS